MYFALAMSVLVTSAVMFAATLFTSSLVLSHAADQGPPGHGSTGAVSSAQQAELPLATFDGVPASTRAWATVNDPVMGGGSVSTFEQRGAVGVWEGERIAAWAAWAHRRLPTPAFPIAPAQTAAEAVSAMRRLAGSCGDTTGWTSAPTRGLLLGLRSGCALRMWVHGRRAVLLAA